jgi:hypothetical protein
MQQAAHERQAARTVLDSVSEVLGFIRENSRELRQTMRRVSRRMV